MNFCSNLPGSSVLHVSWLGVDCLLDEDREGPVVYLDLPELAPWEEWTRREPFRIGNHVLSARTANHLARHGITTLDELSKYPAEVLLEIRRFGPAALKEIQVAMESVGRSLPEKPRHVKTLTDVLVDAFTGIFGR